MNITVSAAQYPITEHATFSVWAAHTETWVSEAAISGSNLLVFPEYGSMELVSIFSKEIRQDIQWQVKELDSLKDEFCNVFAHLAQKYRMIIIAPSIPIIEEGRNVNRAFVFSEKGLVGYQDKFFMTRFENEEWGIESGEKILTLFKAPWGSFGIQICYDVEFGIGSQLLSQAGATVIISPSCTETIRGATRVHVGARARALENQVYSVVAQTVGNAFWSPAVDINYGFAACYCTPDRNLPEEGIVSIKTPQEEGWLHTSLNLSLIEEVRNSGQVFNFKDHQSIQTRLLSSEISIREIEV